MHRLQLQSAVAKSTYTPDVSPLRAVLPGGSWLLIGGRVRESGYTQTCPRATPTSTYLLVSILDDAS